MSRSARFALAGLVALLPLVAVSWTFAAGQLVSNGAFTEGEGEEPSGWRHEAWAKTPSANPFSWARSASGIGVVTIENKSPNDSGWVQNIPVTPSTWYRVSGWVRAENVGSEHLGAYVSVMDTFFNSQDLRGTEPWQQVMLWVKTKPLETSLRIGCRLGGYSSLNTGKAEFTMISVEAAGTPPTGAPFVYGGSPDQPDADKPRWLQGIAILVALAIAFVLWRYLIPTRRH